MRSQPKKLKTPKKLRLTRNIGRAIIDQAAYDLDLLKPELKEPIRWATAAGEGSEVRIWPDRTCYSVQVYGVQTWVNKLTVQRFRRLVVKAIKTPNLPEITLKALRYRRDILDEWLGLNIIERLADVTL